MLRWVVRGRRAGSRARIRERLCGGPAPVEPVEPVDVSVPVDDGFHDVCALSELGPGEIAEFLADGVPIAVAHLDGAIYAVDNVCPHAGGPLGDGELVGSCVVCPLHGWSFDVITGVCSLDPELVLTRYATEVRSGRIRVALSPIAV